MVGERTSMHCVSSEISTRQSTVHTRMCRISPKNQHTGTWRRSQGCNFPRRLHWQLTNEVAHKQPQLWFKHLNSAHTAEIALQQVDFVRLRFEWPANHDWANSIISLRGRRSTPDHRIVLV